MKNNSNIFILGLVHIDLNMESLYHETNGILEQTQVKIKSEHKGTVSVISSDPPCNDDKVRFRTVPLKPLFDQKCGRYCRFFRFKSI